MWASPVILPLTMAIQVTNHSSPLWFFLQSWFWGFFLSVFSLDMLDHGINYPLVYTTGAQTVFILFQSVIFLAYYFTFAQILVLSSFWVVGSDVWTAMLSHDFIS